MEFESTIKGEKATSETCVVYDKKDGRIVHVHEFIGDGTGLSGPQGRKERARLTLESAKTQANAPKRLEVLHVESGFGWAPNKLYRVDVAKRKLVSHRSLTRTLPRGRTKKK